MYSITNDQFELAKFSIDRRMRKSIEKAIIFNATNIQPFAHSEFVFEHYEEIDQSDNVIDIDEESRCIYLNRAGLIRLAHTINIPVSTLERTYFDLYLVTDFIGWPKNPIHPVIELYAFRTTRLTIEYIKYLFK